MKGTEEGQTVIPIILLLTLDFALSRKKVQQS